MNTETNTPCTSPSDGRLLGHSPLDSIDSLDAAFRSARAAQPAWARVPLKERVAAMRRVRDYIVSHADELAETISADNGKTRVDAMATEVFPAAVAASYYCRRAKRFLKSRGTGGSSWLLVNKRSRIHRVPWGVVGVISPWNYPFAIPFSEVVMALLAGNAVILKVATQTQMVGRALRQCFAAAEVPQGVFAHINLPGRVAGDALLEAGIDKLFFTGSVHVGKQLMAKAAETFTPVSLELGGNDPMLVCPDADLGRATAGAVWAGLQNCGQSCGGVERIYVHTDVYESFLNELAQRVARLRVGQDVDHQVDLGAMTTRKQRDVVRQHVEDATTRGAKVHTQSDCPEGTAGNFMAAVVLVDVDHSMRVMREETFGPVVAVMKVDDMDRAVTLANDSELGLTASVWSRSRKTARRLARRLEAGVVTVNDHLVSHGLPDTPWGGFKQSGIGRTHGEIGFAEMTRPQCIVDDLMPWVKKDLWWYPHGPQIYRGLRGALEFLYGRGLPRRIAGFCRLVRCYLRTFRR